MRASWPSTAFVDETRASDSYLLAAVVIEDRQRDELWHVVEDLRIGGTKLHWVAEGDVRRARIVDALSRHSIDRLVVVRLRRHRESDERCRHKCIERLVWRLHEMDVERAVFEAREASQNVHDRELIANLRSSRAVRGPRLRVDHLAGPAEPLLWWADALAGAVARIARSRVQLVDTVDVIER